MNRLFKLLLPILLVVELVLVVSGVLDGQTAIIVVGVVELLALVVGLRQVVATVLRFRHDRAAGLNIDQALEDGLTVIFPRPVARLVALEPRIWVCVFRLLFRRKPLAANEFSYSKRSIIGSFLVIVLFSAPVEIFLFELLIPWEVVRWILLIGSVYSAFWFLGYYASLKVMPYRLEETGLRIYYGVMLDGFIPYTQLARAEAQRRKTPDPEGAKYVAAENALNISCGSRTDVSLHLNAPIVINGLLRPYPPATTLHFAADNPEQLVTELSKCLERESVVPTSQVTASVPMSATA